jgi:small subunit ribosomal protein S2
MRPYIFAARNGIHIIDLEQTQSQIEEAYAFLRDLVAGGEKVLFVGTKKQAQDTIEESCERSGQYYVTHRWMGGMLTNFPVIQRQLKRMADLRQLRERGDFERMSAKEANANADELDRLERNFGGMATMRRLPGALFVVDCRKERLAVTEANKLRIPIVAIVDSNCDPEKIQHVIPGNDDAIRAVRLITNLANDAILEGQRLLSERELRDHEAQLAAEAAAAKAAAQPAAAETETGPNAAGEAEMATAASGGEDREA